tara:strand:+ start:869 stop:1387 length:519 start_codon:yes stop_codon:yes gene_type:complete
MNNFSGIINSDFKSLFKDAISALLYDDALTVPCKIYYGVTKYQDCTNCVYDPIGQKSSNRFQDGGPIPFPFGSICPMCNGDGKKPIETTEDINLMVIWDEKQFMNAGTVNNPEGNIQTVTFSNNIPKLVRAKEIVVNTDLGSYGRYRYQRCSEPQLCGFNSEFVECIWKRSG